MTTNWPLIITLYTGVCILVDKYAAKFYAPGLYIKPEFELIWILILYLVLYATTKQTQVQHRWTILSIIILSLVTLISVFKIINYQI
jgi:hypothetical protein